MCGLSGYTGNTKADKHALRVLLIDNSVRGVHATGIANGEGLMDKKAIALKTYIGYDIFDEIANSKLVMCHNRWSTMKENTTEDSAAHPFLIDDKILGAHNGFIPEWKFQADKIGVDITNIQVDSEMIFHHLANNDYDPRCLSKIEGAMALSWIDLETKVLWLYRRSSRPLHVGEDAEKRLYYSSRENGLWMLGGRGNIELEENIAYGFKNGVLVKMIPIEPPQIYIEMDMGATAFKWALKKNQHELLGLKPPAPVKKNTTKWEAKNNGQTYNQRFNNHTKCNSEYDSFDDWYRAKKRESKPSYYSPSKILSGSLEELTDITINEFDASRSYQLTPMCPKAKKSKHGSTLVSMKVVSSNDGAPVPVAVVFIDHPDSDQYITTMKGYVTMPVPEKKVGGFIRIGVLPYPYDELYHTSLLNLNEGEIMEVSLHVPFRPVDRDEVEKAQEISNSKDSTEPTDGGSSTEIGGKIVAIDRTPIDRPEDCMRGSEDESEHISSDRGYPSSWDGDGSEDDETNEYVSEHYEQQGIGCHDQYGFLFKTVHEDHVTICDKDSKGIVDIDSQEFWSYGFEYRALEQYNHDFVHMYTDTLWGYMRYCGYSMMELINDNRIKEPDANDYIHFEEIEDEAKQFKTL
jgi:hypothetical protein